MVDNNIAEIASEQEYTLILNQPTATGINAHKLFQTLNRKMRLPRPNDSVMKLFEVAKDKKASIDEIAKVIAIDQPVQIKILKTVNSSFYYQKEKVTSIAKALQLLGISKVKRIALCMSMISENTSGYCKNFDYHTYWSYSLARATIASKIKLKNTWFTSDELFTVSLLSQIGKLIFATAYPEKYSNILSKPRTKHSFFEEKSFGVTQNEISFEMMKDIGLPDDFCYAILYQEMPLDKLEGNVLKLVEVLKWSRIITHLLHDTNCVKTKSGLDDIIKSSSHFGFTEDIFPDYFNNISCDWHEISEEFNLNVAPKVLTWESIYNKAS